MPDERPPIVSFGSENRSGDIDVAAVGRDHVTTTGISAQDLIAMIRALKDAETDTLQYRILAERAVAVDAVERSERRIELDASLNRIETGMDASMRRIELLMVALLIAVVVLSIVMSTLFVIHIMMAR